MNSNSRMTKQGPEIVNEHLDEVKKIVAEKKGHLEDRDVQDLLEMLGDDLLLNDNAINQAIDGLKLFGESLVAGWLVRSWSELSNERQKIVTNKLCEKNRKGHMAQKVRLMLAVHLSEIDPLLSWKLLIRTCREAVNIREGLPSFEFCTLMRNIVVQHSNSVINRLSFDHAEDEARLLALCSLRSTLIRSKRGVLRSNPETFCRILEWVDTCPFLPLRSEKLKKELLQSLSSWPENLSNAKKEAAESLLRIFAHPELPGPDVATETLSRQDNGSSKGQSEPQADCKKQITSEKGERRHFDPQEALRRLGEYISKLTATMDQKERENKTKISSQNNKIRELTSRLREADEELTRVALARERTEGQLESIRESLENQRQVSHDLRQQLDKTREELEGSKNLNQELTKRFRNLELENSDLSKRVEAEAQYRVDILKNQIRDSLRKDFQDLRRLETRHMTIEIGSILITQLKRMFSKLNQLEISFQGGSE